MPGHGREVTSVVFSPDGKVLASASYDHTIRLWDPVTGKDHQPRQGHHGPVQAIAVSRDGKTAAAACWYRAVHLWSLESGAQLQELRGHMENIFSVAFSPDGRSVASGSADETIRIWDVATGREVRQLLGHKRFVNSIAFTPVQSMLISAGGDRTVRFWDWSSARELRQIKTDGNSQMSISRDGRIVGALGEQATIWDVASGKELRRSPGQFALAPDGRTFVTQASDGLIRQWNIATGEQQIAFPGPTYSESWRGPVGLVLSPDSRLLAGRHGTGIGIWELATGKVRRQLDNHQGGIVPFVFSPDGRTMLTGGEDTTILIWDLARRHEIRPAQLAPADLDALWRDLGGDDPERADRAIGALAARADQSVPFLKKHLRPAIAPDPKRLRALITDLDSDQFAVRDKAFKELQGERDLATAALREALDKPPSLESRRRIEDLLARQCVVLTAGDLLQSVRAVEVLERIDNLDARKLLQKLASGAAHARLSQEALDALSRLGPQ